MKQRLTIAIAGIGGYGNGYVAALLDAPPDAAVHLTAVADPAPHLCRRVNDLTARNVPIFPSLESLYADHTPDVLIISTPLQYHADQTCLALSHGSHVLCEKPLCVTPAQIQRMLTARDAAGRHVAIGYQWSFSRAMQALKADILAGRLGAPRRLRTLVLWPRDEVYYSRNRWAGMRHDAHGHLVLDSPVNNACAHHLHNMLYLLGDRTDRSATPATVHAELYRAHPIDNYDTAALRCRTHDGAELLLVASHATDAAAGPAFTYEFDDATVDFRADPMTGAGHVTARLSNGLALNYGSPVESRDRKLWLTLDAIRDNRPTLCGIEAATPHTLCAHTAQLCVDAITAFPASLVHQSGDPGRRKTWVTGLTQDLHRCYDQSALPSELAFAWARPARTLPIQDATTVTHSKPIATSAHDSPTPGSERSDDPDSLLPQGSAR